jgi:Na+-transporting methylmalonyl-CoA/oxaloacetate decarboxylase gamma subunit
MNPIPILAMTTEELAHSHSVMHALPHLGGMLMVLVTLTLLWGLAAGLSKLVAVFMPLPKPPMPASATAAPGLATAPVPDADTLTPELVAVIAAAVSTVTAGKGRIISIKPMSSSWEKAGRQSVLTSHRIR